MLICPWVKLTDHLLKHHIKFPMINIQLQQTIMLSHQWDVSMRFRIWINLKTSWKLLYIGVGAILITFGFLVSHNTPSFSSFSWIYCIKTVAVISAQDGNHGKVPTCNCANKHNLFNKFNWRGTSLSCYIHLVSTLDYLY